MLGRRTLRCLPLRFVPHPLTAHDVKGCGLRESGQIHSSVKQSHHMRNVPDCVCV